MRIEEAVKLLEEHEKEYMDDGKELVKGLLIMEKYKPISQTSAEHDVFYVAEFNEEMTAEDLLQLNKYGFHLEDDVESWAYFT